VIWFTSGKERAKALSLCYVIAMKKDNKKLCSYCGEAPVNHKLLYVENFFLPITDAHMISVVRYAPKFLKDFANLIPILLFKTFIKLGLAKFSSDIEKAKSFRSRIIWEEANKRGIYMEQIILRGKPLDWYRAKLGTETIYFESIPIQSEYLDFKKDWDNKIVLKKELAKHNIPVPLYKKLPLIRFSKLERIFSKFSTPIIIKPQLGSRARHTITNINTLQHFKDAIGIASQISPHLVVEEHLSGYICRATVIGGVLAGFYIGEVPSIIGDGEKTIKELINEKNRKQNDRYQVRIEDELYDHISRFGFNIDDILPRGVSLSLSHRAGQLFGGHTKEMINELHPSFVPILEKAGEIVGLSVAGFDCIIPDPTKDESTQHWGIIECNTLPFIDMHYYALEGKPRNIAGMIWDLWK
jgi:D-alanine-D-alanine ligase-like ATP-grasp enzyme